MDRRFHLVALITFLCGLTCWWLFADHGSAVTASSNAPMTEPTEQPQKLSEEETQRQFEALERDKQTYAANLSRQEAERQKRDQAAARTAEVREQLQYARQASWSQVLSTNWQVYQDLRTRASASHGGTTHCTICNGVGQMDFCILCEGSGKCPTCGGAGKLSNGELCSNCLGNRKCYLCGGTGKMVCPFCDDGVVYKKLPLPPNLLPTYCQAPSYAVAAPDSSPKDTSLLPPEPPSKTPGQVKHQGPRLAPPQPTSYNNLLLAVALLLAGGLALRKITELLERRFNAAPAGADDRALRKKLIAEEPAMVAFLNALRDGLNTPPDQAVPEALVALNSIQAQTNADESGTAVDALHEFFDSAPTEFARLRALFSEISRTPGDAVRLKLLLGFSEQVRPPKVIAQVPALRPIWLVAFALEGLLKQLSCKASNVTPSTLRTAAGALDLLETLCIPSLKPDLATEPPIRLLAVDDDPVCHRAISLSLKKVFHEPDLAPGGEAALALVEQHAYDVIFLDVEMPGMNGFELCSKIRETVLNRTTPVVFVTRHSDFNSRAKSSLSGGQELIAKPYLPFEIVVKALTLALRGRLQNGAAEFGAAGQWTPGGNALITEGIASEVPAVIISSTRPILVAAASAEELDERIDQPEEREHESNTVG
jgi:CheY-like chemotaxis protein